MAKTTLYLGPTIRRHTPERRLAFDIFPSNETDTCFTVVVYDSKERNAKMKNACVIVPAAQEHLWLYSTAEGNQELAMKASCSRLLLIWLKYTKDVSNLLNMNPLDSYNDERVMEYIKRNLAETLDNFSLERSSGITIMKVGESARIRGWICEIPSKYAGKVIVRDVYHEETSEYESKKRNGDTQIYARQMIFASNPQVIQSEVLYSEHGSKKEFRFRDLTNEYHTAITLAMGFVTSERRVLILGGGKSGRTGVLTNVLLEEVENKFAVVELDEAVLKVAREYFGYTVEETIDLEEIDSVELESVEACVEPVEPENVEARVDDKHNSNVTSGELKVIHYTGDALQFIRKSKRRYAAIILDINNSNEQNDMKSGDRESESGLRSGVLMSPSPEFLNPEVLDKMKELLEENRGILVLNTLTRSREARKAVLSKLSEKFKFIAKVKTPNESSKFEEVKKENVGAEARGEEKDQRGRIVGEQVNNSEEVKLGTCKAGIL
ncbi:conserved hypothetical protein [Theileria orientalis strain Shintoku]|uniref:Spermidine synthase n=1 Tax=Theileria orientalis strain Shintoku TaxID=869250 RepID=J7MET9_THEOR|nr:conserved hypothetical protein [Theileria orientalis strain Shintoku]BAM38729.1 conserved hypothetical protein [Theileria orientalis strain Shintoku]|eukprot:XP_009689030.1 conserved hypothetical protein [Theileria orientalis strain Shintoku]